MPWPFSRPDIAANPQAPRRADGERDPVADLVGALPDPALAVARNRIVLAANPALCAIVGADPAGGHLTAAFRAPQILEAVEAVLRHGTAIDTRYEIRLPTPRQFQVVAAPVGDARGAGPAALIVLKDLTHAQQVEQLRVDFVANASHEIRTPLASLLGFIETLMGAARDDAAARDKFLALMRKEAMRMKRLIDDLLSLSRIEMNEHVPPTGTADLAKVAQHVADVMSGMAAAEACELRLAAGEGLEVPGDWDELVQVVQNLVENAIKYASAGRFIDIETGRDGEWAVLTVSDHGPGIAAEHLPRLTERFYRVSVQASRSRGGTGLGLAIVKHILNRHRGRLSIRSEPGKGSSFSFRLRLRDL
jgi:two-component system phosphate regulon sensor histidine kinase PhoR